jgi:hypothetical protein
VRRYLKSITLYIIGVRAPIAQFACEAHDASVWRASTACPQRKGSPCPDCTRVLAHQQPLYPHLPLAIVLPTRPATRATTSHPERDGGGGDEMQAISATACRLKRSWKRKGRGGCGGDGQVTDGGNGGGQLGRAMTASANFRNLDLARIAMGITITTGSDAHGSRHRERL